MSEPPNKKSKLGDGGLGSSRNAGNRRGLGQAGQPQQQGGQQQGGQGQGGQQQGGRGQGGQQQGGQGHGGQQQGAQGQGGQQQQGSASSPGVSPISGPSTRRMFPTPKKDNRGKGGK